MTNREYMIGLLSSRGFVDDGGSMQSNVLSVLR